MIRTFLFVLLVFTVQFVAFSQQKSALTIDDFTSWNRLSNKQISQDGSLITYQIKPGMGDETLMVQNHNGNKLLDYKRGENASIIWDVSHVIFKIKPAIDSVRALKRIKTDKEKMPQDSLAVFSVSSQTLTKISPIIDFKVPEEWSGYLAYRLDEIRKDESDTTESKSKEKKVSEDNGYHLVIQNLEDNTKDTLKYVTQYMFAKKGEALIYETTGMDSTISAGLIHLNLENGTATPLLEGKYSYKQLALSEEGDKVAFLADTSSNEPLVRNYILNYWENGWKEAQMKIDSTDLPSGWIVSEHGKVEFSENSQRVFFGTAPIPPVKDTTLLEDEIMQVEIWSHHDKRLQTQQEYEKKDDLKKNYRAIFYPGNDKYVQIGQKNIPDILFSTPKKDNRYALGSNNEPYLKATSWEGFPPRADLYLVNLETGEAKVIAKEKRAYADPSPGDKYLYWYNVVDTAWFAYDISSGRTTNLTQYLPTTVADELDDHPDFPSPYGVAGWTKNDKEILIYDRYDIWKVDPGSVDKPVNLTKGRDKKTRYRYRDLDKDDPFIDLNECYLHFFNETTKNEGFAKLTNREPLTLLTGGYAYEELTKAKNSDRIFFTKENNEVFPDIVTTNLKFENTNTISNGNPQQKGKLWSTNEIITWTSLNGEKLEGILYKPEDFDPNKQYPMMVYFYERNSHNLNRYWGSFPHRSIINPNFYASRGYLVFIPDIIYRDGYPGPSCYDAVIPGVTMLIDQGFVDTENIGVQGHSWGGYQSAYLITRTDIFACAESGAPVANMFSAYGGIRWGSGLSRMFQYEHTQSRIGGTIWEYPMRYYENSPLFFVDKINTPVLIMHNDQDGAVPWYQGIEFFVALRRLNKPVWMLNYNNEPHWPTKRENIIDFQTRMLQFFDHYLMNKPMPEWMSEGIPAIEKGINKGY